MNEHLFALPEKWKIFISSQMRDRVLDAERRTAAEAVEETGFATAWYWERDAHAGPYSAENVCIGQASTSDGLILILAQKLTPVTRKEYQAAKAAKIPCYIMVKQDVRLSREVKQFIEQEQKYAVWRPFSSLQELRSQIVSDLRYYIVQASRKLASLVHVHSETHELLLQSVETMREMGRPRSALAVLNGLKALSHPSQISSEQRGWLLNSEGLAKIALGQYDDARLVFEEMKSIGDVNADKYISSTALQNLAAIAVEAGNYDEAKRLYRESWEIKQQIHDYYGITQILLNWAGLSYQCNELEKAQECLDLVEPLIRKARDRHFLFSLYNHRGILAALRKRFDEAETYYRKAYSLMRQKDNPIAQVVITRNLGSVYLDQGKLRRSLFWFYRALWHAETLEAPVQLEMCYRGLAVALSKVRRYDEAIHQFEQARRLSTELGDEYGWATATADMGAMSIELDRLPQAVELLSAALNSFRGLGDRDWQYRVLRNLLVAHNKASEFESAIRVTEQALEVLDQSAHHERADVLWTVAAAIVQRRGWWEQAAAFFNRSLSEIAAISANEYLAWHAATAGASLSHYGAYRLSLQFFTRALRIYEQDGAEEQTFLTLNDRAIALTQLGRYDEAEQGFRRCLEIATQRQDTLFQFQALQNLGETLRRQRRTEEAQRALQKAIDISRVLNDVGREAEALGSLGIALVDLGRLADAETVFKRCRQLARKRHQLSDEAHAIGGLGGVALQRGRPALAARLFRRAVEIWDKTDDRVHLAEDLAGLVESLAAGGRVTEIEQPVQRLVDIAQDSGQEELAAISLAWSAKLLLGYDHQHEAAELYSAAIVLALVEDIPDNNDFSDTLAKVLAELAVDVHRHLPNTKLEFLELVVRNLDSHAVGLGDGMHDTIRRLLQMDLAELPPDGI